MTLKLEVVPALGWERCLSVTHGGWRALLTLEVGPRLIHFGPTGGPNLLWVAPADAGRRGGRRWRIYGGHRFWVAPERKPYPPDNAPVAWRRIPGGVRLSQPREPGVPWRKELELSPGPRRGGLRLRHRLINAGRRTVTAAPWALTVLPGGGEARVPLPRRGAFPRRVQPAGPLVLWPYTDLADPRWRFTGGRLRLRVPRGRAPAQKIGLAVPAGWAAYRRGAWDLTLRFRPPADRERVDFGAHVELFTQDGMVELETLGPCRSLEPGEAVVHDEHWSLRRVRESSAAARVDLQ